MVIVGRSTRSVPVAVARHTPGIEPAGMSNENEISSASTVPLTVPGTSPAFVPEKRTVAKTLEPVCSITQVIAPMSLCPIMRPGSFCVLESDAVPVHVPTSDCGGGSGDGVPVSPELEHPVSASVVANASNGRIRCAARCALDETIIPFRLPSSRIVELRRSRTFGSPPAGTSLPYDGRWVHIIGAPLVARSFSTDR
jgi:hypothetical protein